MNQEVYGVIQILEKNVGIIVKIQKKQQDGDNNKINNKFNIYNKYIYESLSFRINNIRIYNNVYNNKFI